MSGLGFGPGSGSWLVKGRYKGISGVRRAPCTGERYRGGNYETAVRVVTTEQRCAPCTGERHSAVVSPARVAAVCPTTEPAAPAGAAAPALGAPPKTHEAEAPYG